MHIDQFVTFFRAATNSRDQAGLAYLFICFSAARLAERISLSSRSADDPGVAYVRTRYVPAVDHTSF